MWKKRYIIAVGLCLLLTSWFLSQALYHRIAVQETASPDTEAKPAPALVENNTTEESQAIDHLPVHADEPPQKMSPLPAARTTTPASAARVGQAQAAVEPAQKDTSTAVATHLPAQALIPEADRSVGSEFPATAEKTKISDLQTRVPLSTIIVPLPFTLVEAKTLALSMQPADSSTIADILSQELDEEAVEPQRPAMETRGEVEAKAFALSMQPADSSTIADVHAKAPLADAVVQQSPNQAAASTEPEAVALATHPEHTVTIKASGKTPLSVVAQTKSDQNKADVDEEQIYEDILNLIKSKMALEQSDPAAHPEPAIVLASQAPTTKTAPGLRPIQQTRPARHGIGLAIGTAQPDMAEKVRIPVFAEMYYRYQSTHRTQLQVAAGATPLLWPGGRQSLQISADLIGRYGLFVHQRIQPNLSFGLGMLSTRIKSGLSLASGTLLAGGGVNLSLAQQWNLGLQVQYKYCLQNPASVSSTRRDGYLQIKTELTFNIRHMGSIRLQTEENYLAEKQ